MLLWPKRVWDVSSALRVLTPHKVLIPASSFNFSLISRWWRGGCRTLWQKIMEQHMYCQLQRYSHCSVVLEEKLRVLSAGLNENRVDRNGAFSTWNQTYQKAAKGTLSFGLALFMILSSPAVVHRALASELRNIWIQEHARPKCCFSI